MSYVPDSERFVIRNRSEDLAMVRRKADIFHFRCMPPENSDRFDSVIELVRFLDIPETNEFIIRA